MYVSEEYLDVGGVCVGGGDVRLPVFGWFGQILGVCHDPFHPRPSWYTKKHIQNDFSWNKAEKKVCFGAFGAALN